MKASVLPGMGESPGSRYWVTRNNPFIHGVLVSLLERSENIMDGLLLKPLAGEISDEAFDISTGLLHQV
jgi:hypothetical protein